MKRHAKSYARENAIKMLYTHAIEKKTEILTDSNISDPMARTWVTYIVQNEAEFNTEIKKYLKKWTINELNPINLAILQVAIYELKFDETPAAIVVNEAIEFAKKYSDDNSKAFVTYVLKEISKDISND
ncbi:transcription antitermination factor NusB [Mollicutes bacterium LVI A0039]|nr:transcription antitermination factor NusB [Mollicutes bacterium LVI A0039]